jgi:hypothetical protein
MLKVLSLILRFYSLNYELASARTAIVIKNGKSITLMWRLEYNYFIII